MKKSNTPQFLIGLFLISIYTLYVNGDTITQTVSRPIPSYSATVPYIISCDLKKKWESSYNPGLPVGAVILSSTVSGYVDDAVKFNGQQVGACNARSYNNVDLTSYNADGSFTIELFDATIDPNLTWNAVYLEGINTITYVLTNAFMPPATPTNVESEICSGSCEDRNSAACESLRMGCPDCSQKGSPQPVFHPGSMDVQIQDTPIWHNTAVGPELSLKLRYSNYGNTNSGRPFGGRWQCNWNSFIRAVNSSSLVMRFQSGSITEFNLQTNGLYVPMSALNGSISQEGSNYVYRKPDGYTWQYQSSEQDTNHYLLSAVSDAWSNKLELTYSDDRLWRISQTVPSSGRYLQFNYSGTGTLVQSVSTEPAAYRWADFSYSDAGMLTNVVDMGGYEYSFTYTNAYLEGIFRGSTEGYQRLDVQYSETPDNWTFTNEISVVLTDGEGNENTVTWEHGAVSVMRYRAGFGTNYSSYSYAAAGGRASVLTRQRDAYGRTRQAEYGANGRVTNSIDYAGVSSSRSYNDQNRVLQTVNSLGATTTHVYAENGYDLLYTVRPDGVIEESTTYVSGRHVPSMQSNVMGRVIEYQYNQIGLVTNMYDGRQRFEYDYDAEGRLLTVTRNGVLNEQHTYDTFGRPISSLNQDGLLVSNTYDRLDRLTSVQYFNHGQVAVESNVYSCCTLEKKIDRRGGEWLYDYNDVGELCLDINPKGLTNFYVYNQDGKLSATSNRYEYLTKLYNSLGQLMSTELPARTLYDRDTHKENYFYDSNGRMVKKQGYTGEWYMYDYDTEGRRTAEYVPDGTFSQIGVTNVVQAETNRYDLLGWLVWTRDIRGLEISNVYNEAGYTVQKIYPDGTSEDWTYNAWGDVTGFSDRGGRVTSNIYDSAGRRIEEIRPGGVHVYYEYNAGDRVTVVSNAASGFAQKYAYDSEGRIITNTAPDGTVEQRYYDPAGNVSQLCRAGITETYTYDEMNNRTSRKINGCLVESNRYDGLSRRVFSQDGSGVIITNAYDSWGVLSGKYRSDGSSETFTYEDTRLITSTDRSGRTNYYLYDVLGQLLQKTNRQQLVARYAYETNGYSQMALLEDGNGNQTEWKYDQYGQVTEKNYANLSGDALYYDELGRLTGKVDCAMQSIAYQYDQYDNMVAAEYAAGLTNLYSYDVMNRRTGMVDQCGTTEWVLDTAGHMLTEKTPWSSLQVDASYDEAGRLTNVLFDGYSWTYRYDNLSRISSIQAPEGYYFIQWYSNSLHRSTISGPDGVTVQYSYNAARLPETLSMQNATGSLLQIDYSYDSGGQRTGEVWSTGRDLLYQYDINGQLVAVTTGLDPRDIASYAYDHAGNPVRREVLGSAVSNDFNILNQVVSSELDDVFTVMGEVNYNCGTVMVNGVMAEVFTNGMFVATNIAVVGTNDTITAVYSGPAFTNTQWIATDSVSVVTFSQSCQHDANGNLTEDGEFWYHYDAANQLTTVYAKPASNEVLSCQYDGMGRRREVIRNGTNTERYVYLPGTFQVLAILDGANAIKEIFTHGPDLSGSLFDAGGVGGIWGAVNMIDGTTNRLHCDAMGNVVMVTDTTGQPVCRYHYESFGRIIEQEGSVQSRYRFSSKEYDAESGLYYYGYRFYSPDMGRWLNRDPIGEQGGINLYGFVKNAPVLNWDYLGQKIRIRGSDEVIEAVLYALAGFIRGQLSVDKKGYLERKPYPPDCDDCPKDEMIEKWVDEMLAASDIYNIYLTEDTGFLMGDGSFTPDDFGDGGDVKVDPDPDDTYPSGGFFTPEYGENTLSSVLAHELLGRAYAHCSREEGANKRANKLSSRIKAKLNKKAVERANHAYDRLGLDPRSHY